MDGRIWISGATGYLGGAVARAAARRGRNLRLFVRRPEAVPEDLRAAAEITKGDLVTGENLERSLEGTSAVIHVAGMASDWSPDNAEFKRANVEATGNVLAAMERAGPAVGVFTSTVMALGPTDGLEAGDESTRPPASVPRLPYLLTKRAALDAVRSARNGTLDLRAVFPGALYGEGPLTDGNYLARVIECLLQGTYPALPKLQSQRWCLAHVDDVAAGHLLALEKGRKDGEYVLGGPNVRFDELLDVIGSRLPVPFIPRKVPGWAMVAGLRLLYGVDCLRSRRPIMTPAGGKALLRDWTFSSARAKRELGYSWRSFPEGFAEFVDWYGRIRKASRDGARKG